MTSRNDAQVAAMQATVDGDAFNDLMLRWLQANGAIGDTVTDCWTEFLDERGMPPGHVNDRLYAWLGDIGYDESDHLTDRMYQWCVDGMVVPGASA